MHLAANPSAVDLDVVVATFRALAAVRLLSMHAFGRTQSGCPRTVTHLTSIARHLPKLLFASPRRATRPHGGTARSSACAGGHNNTKLDTGSEYCRRRLASSVPLGTTEE